MFGFNEKHKLSCIKRNDINYFKYKLYNYDKLQIDCITKSIIREINNLNTINNNLKQKSNSIFYLSYRS